MDYNFQLELLVRLLIAAALGGIIGVERERGSRAAGLRTNILVSSGSALIMLVSLYGFNDFYMTRDPARIAAQVVSGIGFLGAGTIIHEGANVKGLTTAATLWVVSAIGLTIGCGMIFVGVGATIITLITLTVFRSLEQKSSFLAARRKMNLFIVVNDKTLGLNNIIKYFNGSSINFNILKIMNEISENKSQIEVSISLRKKQELDSIIANLLKFPGIVSVEEDID
jgi:putative Mg2+ transporter-C (MgtC) family protein